MQILSVEQMREADRFTIEKGTPSKELMRRAAQGIYDAYPGWAGSKILVVCGSGNNAGDGYALAEILKNGGHAVTVLRVTDRFSDDGRYYYENCLKADVPVLNYGSDAVDFETYQVIVDCLLGTGFHGIPEEPFGEVIGEINYARANSGVFVISADINSGLNGDTGEGENAVVSDLTVSIGFYKKGFFEGKAPHLIGNLTNVDIGIEVPEGLTEENVLSEELPKTN